MLASFYKPTKHQERARLTHNDSHQTPPIVAKGTPGPFCFDPGSGRGPETLVASRQEIIAEFPCFAVCGLVEEGQEVSLADLEDPVLVVDAAAAEIGGNGDSGRVLFDEPLQGGDPIVRCPGIRSVKDPFPSVVEWSEDGDHCLPPIERPVASAWRGVRRCLRKQRGFVVARGNNACDWFAWPFLLSFRENKTGGNRNGQQD